MLSIILSYEVVQMFLCWLNENPSTIFEYWLFVFWILKKIAARIAQKHAAVLFKQILLS